MSKKKYEGKGKRNGSKNGSQKAFASNTDTLDGNQTKSKYCYEEGRHSSGNDYSWYNRYPLLLRDAARFPYPYRPGRDLPMGTFTGLNNSTGVIGSSYKYSWTIPGVMLIDFLPCFSYSDNSTDGPSLVGNEIYARVRNAYSSALDADGPDYIMYLGGLDSIFMAIGTAKRLLRFARGWTPSNYITPDTLLESLGMTAAGIQDLRENYANYERQLNLLILQTRKFKCPAVMDLFNRHYWMCDHVYTDANSENSQFFIFNCMGYYTFDTDGSGAGMLRMGYVTPTTMQVLLEWIGTALQKMTNEDTNLQINGYLARAYEGVPSFEVMEFDWEKEPPELSYDEEVLMQIENSTLNRVS